MAPLRFSAVKGVPGTYEVRRGDVLLGCVSAVEVTETTVWPSKARLRKVVRWQFQRIGGGVHRLHYTTRRKAAQGLAVVFDAFAKTSRAQDEG